MYLNDTLTLPTFASGSVTVWSSPTPPPPSSLSSACEPEAVVFNWYLTYSLHYTMSWKYISQSSWLQCLDSLKRNEIFMIWGAVTCAIECHLNTVMCLARICHKSTHIIQVVMDRSTLGNLGKILKIVRRDNLRVYGLCLPDRHLLDMSCMWRTVFAEIKKWARLHESCPVILILNILFSFQIFINY